MTATVQLRFSDDGHEALSQLRAAGRFTNVEELVRVALWYYALHNYRELDVPSDAFVEPKRKRKSKQHEAVA